jgi:hypothetical protein
VETEFSIQDRHPKRMLFGFFVGCFALADLSPPVLFIDLINHYDAILPPTLARKKRDSDRPLPQRKRTAPVDIRPRRGNIPAGSDPQQVLVGQQMAQNPSLRHRQSPSLTSPPPVPPLPLQMVQGRQPLPPPPHVVQSPPVPPPPPLHLMQVPPPPPLVPPPPPLPYAHDNPPRPVFKEPPPESEYDDAPARPTFKEPPPESSSPSPPPRPAHFAEPPVEESPTLAAPRAIPPPPPLLQAERSPSPSGEPVLKGSLSRNVSGSSSSTTSTTVIRGPRLAGARGPRAPSGGVVNKTAGAAGGKGGGGSPPSPSPALRRLSGSGQLARTPSDAAKGRSSPRSSLSRRTMASDAEDNLVQK